jgi:hypothetical protein
MLLLEHSLDVGEKRMCCFQAIRRPMLSNLKKLDLRSKKKSLSKTDPHTSRSRGCVRQSVDQVAGSKPAGLAAFSIQDRTYA